MWANTAVRKRWRLAMGGFSPRRSSTQPTRRQLRFGRVDALNHLLAWMETTAGAHTSKNDGKYVRALTLPPPVTLSRRDMVIVRAADAG
jgi:hypothetical protein